MKPMTRAIALPLALFGLAAGCDSKVDLELDLVSPGPPRAAPPVLGWSATADHDSVYHDVDWMPDGSITVGGTLHPIGAEPHVAVETAYLARFAPDGTLQWSHEIDGETLLGDAQAEGEDRLIEIRTVIKAIDALADGSAVVALDTSTTIIEDGAFSLSERSFLQWYAADGSLVRTRALDATGDSEAIVLLQSVLALPDGGVVFTGATTSGPIDIGMMLTGGIVARLDAEANVVWSVPVGQSVASPANEETLRDLSLTSDGGIIFGGGFAADITVGDKQASGLYGAYFARLELDGTATWLRVFEGVEGLGVPSGMAMSVTPEGHILAAGFFTRRLQMDDLSLEIEDGEIAYYLAELDASGTAINLHQLDPLPPTVGDSNHRSIDAVALDGDRLVVAGGIQEAFDSDERHVDIALEGPYTASYDLAGRLLDARRMAVSPHQPGDQGDASAIELSPTGHLAVTGSFSGRIDFGAGPIQSAGVVRGFVAVYEPGKPDVD
jgi:hypothetical protein